MEMKKYKLGDIIELQRGYDLPHSEMEKGNVPVAGSSGIIGYHSISKINPPCITIGRSGSVGKLFFYNEAIWPHNTSLYIKNFKKNNEKYIFYLLKTVDFERLCDSSVVPSLNRNFVYPIKVPFYDKLSDQQKIATVLSSLDDKIALNNRINAKLEQMAKRLYDYWFVQFDFPRSVSGEPCLHELSRTDDGNARSDFPGIDGKPYKSSGGKMVWNEELKREIPEGWEVKKISEILECEIPGDWGEENIKGKHDYKVSCIRGCDMVDMTDLPTRYILQANAKKLLQADDFVIEISGGSPTQSTGRIVQVTEEIINRFDNKVICSNFCHGVRVANKNYISYFYQMWNIFNDNGVFFNFEGKTSGLKNFQFDTFVDQKWYFPSDELAKRFNETVMKVRKEIDKNETENKRLSQLRDKLLPLLMNGQVVVEEKSE